MTPGMTISALPDLGGHVLDSDNSVVEFHIIIDCTAGDRLGLHVVECNDTVLLIQLIKEGAIAKWNERHPDKAVRVGDRIVTVNRINGDSARLTEILAERKELHITIQRLPIRKTAGKSVQWDEQLHIEGHGAEDRNVRGNSIRSGKEDQEQEHVPRLSQWIKAEPEDPPPRLSKWLSDVPSNGHGSSSAGEPPPRLSQWLSSCPERRKAPGSFYWV